MWYMKNRIGIIGFGSFGQFIYKQLNEYFDIIVRDSHMSKHVLKEFGIENSSLKEFRCNF